MTIRAITNDELTTLRTTGQWSELKLAGTEMPPVIFAAQVNGVATTNDMIAEFDYDAVTTGAHTDIIPGMTVLIGSNPGGYDWGVARIRKAATATKIYIGEGSEIDWANLDNRHVTVIDEFAIWPRHIRINPSTHVPYMDYDIEYSDQHLDFDPVPVMGSNMVVETNWGAELVVNGGFDGDTHGWSALNELSLAAMFGDLVITKYDASDYALQNIGTNPGWTYTLGVRIAAFTNDYELLVDGVQKLSTADGAGIKTISFTAAGYITEIKFRAYGAANAVLEIDDVTAGLDEIIINFDGSDSWVFDSTVTGWDWSATQGVMSDGATSTPYLTISSFPTDGLIRISCEVTANNGKSFTGYRYIRFYNDDNPAFTDFSLDECGGDFDSGGWSFKVTLYDNATRTEIRDRAPITLYANDYYGDNKASIGQYSGRENIVACGWVDGESITYDPPNGGVVSFTVQGAHFWLNKISGFPQGTEMAKHEPNAWTDMPQLTVDRAIWHLLHWRSTITAVCDISLTGDTRYAAELSSVSSTLWEQIKEVAYNTILASPGVDQYGNLFVFIHPQLTPEADRTWATIMTITEDDFHERIDLTRRVVSEVGLLSSSGIAVAVNTGKGKAFFSLSNGHVFKRYGRVEIVERLLLQTQAQANELCGLMMGYKNNQYPNVNVRLAMNNRMFNIFPSQFVRLVLAEEDTIRGITFDRNFIPKTVTYQWDAEGRFLLTDLILEAETFPELAVDGDIPEVIEPPEIENPPEWPNENPPRLPIWLPPTESNTNHPKRVIISTNHGVYYTENFDADSDDVEWIDMNEGLTEAEYQSVGGLVVTPDEHIYIMCGANAYGGYDSIYVADGLGKIWALEFSASLYSDQSTSGTAGPAIRGIGVSPNHNNLIAHFGGRTWSWPVDGNIGSWWFGLNDTITSGSAGENSWYRGGISGISFADGGWNVEYGTGTGLLGSIWSAATARFTYGGALSSTNLSPAYGAGYNSYGAPIGTTEATLLWDGAESGIWKVTAYGTVWTAMTMGIEPNSPQGVASSPTGMVMMGGHSTPYRTLDGGATAWESMAGTIPSGSDVWENCGDDNRFIFGGGIVIRLTLDVGETYFDKIGNLIWLDAYTDVQLIRFIE